jgi:hypothetical protein
MHKVLGNTDGRTASSQVGGCS